MTYINTVITPGLFICVAPTVPAKKKKNPQENETKKRRKKGKRPKIEPQPTSNAASRDPESWLRRATKSAWLPVPCSLPLVDWLSYPVFLSTLPFQVTQLFLFFLVQGRRLALFTGKCAS